MNDTRLQPDIIGENLRKLRISKGLTLEEAAGRSGLTKGFLSLVETGRRRINAKDLHSLLSGYGFTTAMFLSRLDGRDSEPEIIIQRSKTMLLLDGKRSDTATHVHLTRPIGQASDAEMTVVYLAPQSLLTDDYITRPGQVRGYVIRGSLLIEFPGDEAVARAGDEFCFDGSRQHLFRNYTDEPTEYIHIVLPT